MKAVYSTISQQGEEQAFSRTFISRTHAMLLYKKTSTLSIYYSYELYAAFALWQGNVTGEDLKASAADIENVMTEYKTVKLVTYSVPMRVIDRNAAQYLAKEWLPRVAGTTLKFWADVVPRLSLKNAPDPEEITEIHDIEGIVLAQFGNIETAKKWIHNK